MMAHLEYCLLETKFFGTDEISLADMSILGTIGFLFVRIIGYVQLERCFNFPILQHLGVCFKKYPKLLAWYESLKDIAGWMENDLGAQNYANKFRKYWNAVEE